MVKSRNNSHQPLQRAKLDALHPLPQPGHLLLNPCLRLSDLQLLPFGLLPDPALFEVQVQLDAGLGAAHLVPQAGGQLGDVVAEAFV